MSTGNFLNRNASKIYAVLMNHDEPKMDDDGNELEETESIACDENDVEDMQSWIEELCDELRKNKKYNFYPDGKSWDNNRNFEGRIMGEVSVSKNFGDIGVDISLQMIMRSGYYEGANLDWECTVQINGEETNEDDIDAIKYFDYYSEMPKGMQVIQANNLERWVSNAKDELIGDVEDIFTKVSMPLVVTARFSNGETMYAKA